MQQKKKEPLKNFLNLKIQQRDFFIRRHSCADSLSKTGPLSRKNSLNSQFQPEIKEKFSLKNPFFKPHHSKALKGFCTRFEDYFPNFFAESPKKQLIKKPFSTNFIVNRGLSAQKIQKKFEETQKFDEKTKKFDGKTKERKIFLEQNSNEKLKKKASEAERDRFSSFLQDSFINSLVNEGKFNLEGVFNEKNRNLQPEIITNLFKNSENKETRMLFQQFLTDKQALKPLKYEKAYEKDLQRQKFVKIAGEEKQTLVLALEYLEKKKRFTCVAKDKLKILVFNIKIAIMNWFSLMNKGYFEPIQVILFINLIFFSFLL